MLKAKRKLLNNEKGMAALELVPILFVIVLFINFSLGFFGAIHTGILNSMASRNYAFETFRNRSDLTYFRSNAQTDKIHFSKNMFRVHGTISESQAGSTTSAPNWIPSARTIDFFSFNNRAADVVGNTTQEHDKTLGLEEGRNQRVAVNPIWIKTLYGICLNASCSN